MEALKPRDAMSRQEVVSSLLRQCALKCDPRRGRLNRLAKVIRVHEVTLSVWIRQGYVPETQVLRLQDKFGPELAPMDDLCPAEFRRG